MSNRIIKGITMSFFQLLIVYVFANCSGQGYTVDVDNVELKELNYNNPEIKIVPIKCSFPMDEPYRSKGYDDYIFILGMSWKTIYCVQNDTVVSVLDASGRGHGEYSYISNFAYSPQEHILYVQGNGKLLRYSVPSMTFINSVDMDITATGMEVLNPEELLMECSFYESEKEIYRGICIVSSQTGRVLHKCYDFDFMNTQMFMTHDMAGSNGGIIFSLNNLDRNSIIRYNIDENSIEELFSFSFNKKWKVSRRLVRLAKKDPLLFSREDSYTENQCRGCHYPYVDDSELVVWCFPMENDEVRSVAVIYKDGELIRRSFKIPGIDIDPSPSFIQNGYCVDVITSSDEVTITDPEKLSPLGKELSRVINDQSYNNPVMLFFTVN